MKKSLIALAALAAVSAASAQSSVTISGNLDFAGSTSGGTQLVAKGTTFATTTGTSSTSVLRFIAVEDLGGGLKATAQYNFDPRTLANDSTAATFVSSSSTSNTMTALARDEMFVGLSGGFGNIRLGSPNSIGLGSFLTSSPLGTGIGSGYTGSGVAGTMTNSYVQTRYNRSVRYDSPSINGFTVSAMYAPGNDQVAVSTVAFAIPNARQGTELGLAYVQGPLRVAYAYVAQDSQTNATGWYGAGSASTSTAKTTVNLLNASYALNTATTLYAGFNSGDRLAAASAGGAANTTKGSRLAVKHTMGAIDLMAQYNTQDSTTTATAVTLKAKVTGLRADYNLSKTAATYIGFEKWDTGTAYAATGSTGDRKIVSIGLRKSF